MGGNFRERLEEGPRIIFHGLKISWHAIGSQMTHVNFELEDVEQILVSTRKDGRVLHERLVSQARPNQPQRGSLSGYKNNPRWGWLGLAY